jgi:uncharacterized cupredoxin-like copper-binding protein
MLKRLVVIGFVALMVALSFGLSSSQAKAATDMFVVKVTLKEWRVEASPASVPAGVPVRFEITNMGVLQHEVVLEEKGAVDEALEADLGGEEPLEAEAERIDPGTSRTMIWTFSDAGAFQLACHIAGHFEAGMVTLLDVTPAAASNKAQIHNSAPVFVAKGKGGVLVHNYYGKDLNFTTDGNEYQVPANGDLFISLEEDSYTYSANVFGDDDSERMDTVDVSAGELSELSFYR